VNLALENLNLDAQKCYCNDAPVCPTDATTNVAACPLNCVNGLYKENGCTYCKCAPVTPCQCEVKPTDPPRICEDGVTYQKYTDVCGRDDANKCSYVLTKCPIGIVVTVKADLSADAVTAIKATLGVTNDADLTITKKVNTDGTVSYTLWINKDGIPADKSAEDANKDALAAVKPYDDTAASYVLSDGTPSKNFGSIVAPVVGLLSLVVLFF